jgi:MFS family permease
MRVSPDSDGVVGHCALGIAHEGPPGYVHGGMSAMLLDELMGWACYMAGSPAMTVSLRMHYYVAYVDERPGLPADVWAGPYGAAALAGETAAAALIASGRLGRPERIPAVTTGAVLLLGGCLLTAAATTSPPVAFAAKVLEGAATNVVGVLAVTFVSLLAAERMRGRMKTLLTTANRVSLGGAKGALPPLAGGLGVHSAYAAAGAVVLAGAALATLLLRRRER